MLEYIVVGVLLLFGYYLLRMYQGYSRYPNLKGLSQLLPDSPVRIPLLAPHSYNSCMADLANKFKKYYGDETFVRVTCGPSTRLFARSAEAFKELVLKQADNFPKPPDDYSVLNLFGYNIVSTNDEEWKIHRRVCEPAFSEKHMRFLVTETAKSVELMFERFGNKEIVIDAEKEMIDVTLDIIGKVNFGADLGVYKEVEYDPKVHTMSMRKALELTLTLGLLARGMLPNWTNWMFPESCRAVDESEIYIKELIDNKLNSKSNDQFDLLSLIARSNEASLELTKQDMVSDSFIFLFAGHETSATTLQWLLYELSVHQDMQTKVREEAESVLKGRDPVYDDYDALKYTGMVISEALRLHPPVNFIPKISRRDCTVLGTKILKGTKVYLDVYSVQRSAKYFDNPLEFRPERFDKDNDKTDKIVPFSYAPFSLGARKCIGSLFSLLETTVILVKILQKYDVVPLPETPVPIPEVQIVTIKPADLKVRLVPRS